MINDTIAAISTPLGEGGIAVIRISGDGAIAAAEQVFAPKNKLGKAETHTVHYGHIVDPSTGERLEETLVTVMRAPRSFTMEDVVEIGCHGGLVSVKRVLDLLLQKVSGVRLAEPGEFTKRAFLNGRIDLAQAEAVIDLIRAKSDRAHKVAMKQVEGDLSRRIRDLRHKLVELMAHIEVNIDYPEHDVEEMTSAFIREKSSDSIAAIHKLLKAAQEGKIIREGITTAIVGRPNVGKSSLLNALARENKAIVTDIPGTTRDVIEEYVTMNGIPLKLLDTAGIRETADLVEKIGVERSRGALQDADLILLVLNVNEPLHDDEKRLLDELRNRKIIVILNKTDLPVELDQAFVEERIPQERLVSMAVKENEGLEELEKAVTDLFFQGGLESEDLTYVSNARHIQLLKESEAALTDAMEAVDLQIPIDMIQIDVRRAWEALGEVIGEEAGDSLIDQIFTQFCLGK
ncbi:tRNA uridine-5-carboxymethylaminomethyl(34) synthesis GTPase MnmE [Gorillibacterium massiliense]|uniref:tRNA uridine-5-carboxymethylaminomethyl(34) synthesis GTPase MnmE n=1 Tax=Gorillibacterium massiliense TaxID=1280390 RepID=UPI0004B0E4A8|nr:tRNA uridine-5-carboxymethylaminomethyl(34) synthesis GTPase MnmE [Gorillibacterium massiliense]